MAETMNQIRTIRQRQGLTLQQVAERIDANTSFLSKLERGKARLTTHWAERLAEALDCEPQDIAFPDTSLTDLEKQVLDQFRALAAGEREELLANGLKAVSSDHIIRAARLVLARHERASQKRTSEYLAELIATVVTNTSAAELAGLEERFSEYVDGVFALAPPDRRTGI